MDKIFVIVHYGKSSISIFQDVFVSIDKFSFCEEDRAQGNNFMIHLFKIFLGLEFYFEGEGVETP